MSDSPTQEDSLARISAMLKSLCFFAAGQVTRDIQQAQDPQLKGVLAIMLFNILSASLSKEEAEEAMTTVFSKDLNGAKATVEIIKSWQQAKN